MFTKNKKSQINRDLDKFDVEQDMIGQLIKENEHLRENIRLLEQRLENQRIQVKELEDELSEIPAISVDKKNEKIKNVDGSDYSQYEYLLEQYQLEHEKYERLFKYLFLKQENVAISLLEKVELADLLIDAKGIGKEIVQNAEAEAKDVYLKVIDFLQELVDNEDNLSTADKEKIRGKIRFLTNDFLMTNQ